MRLLMVQHGGDYREAVQRLAAGGQETYYAQRYTVETLAKIGREIGEAAVLCYLTQEPYSKVLENGVRSLGAGYQQHQSVDHSKIFSLIEEYNPDRIIVQFLDRPLLNWAVKQNRRVMVMLADAPPRQGLKEQLEEFLFANLLNHPRIEWVASHGLTACSWLQAIGVNSNKIVPWDYAYSITPDDFPIKSLRRVGEPWNLTYVGTLSEVNGVGDLLKAAAQLKAQGLSFKLRMVGDDNPNYLTVKAKQFGVEDCLEVLGTVAIGEIERLMRQADLVIMPTHPNDPERFPLVIYHALRSRTPCIVSDHPMFRTLLEHRMNAMMFPAGNATALASCIQTVLSSPALYRHLSSSVSEGWDRLQMPVKWAPLIRGWLGSSLEDRHWLHAHRLASGQYVQNWAHRKTARAREKAF